MNKGLLALGAAIGGLPYLKKKKGGVAGLGAPPPSVVRDDFETMARNGPADQIQQAVMVMKASGAQDEELVQTAQNALREAAGPLPSDPEQPMRDGIRLLLTDPGLLKTNIASAQSARAMKVEAHRIGAGRARFAAMIDGDGQAQRDFIARGAVNSGQRTSILEQALEVNAKKLGATADEVKRLRVGAQTAVQVPFGQWQEGDLVRRTFRARVEHLEELKRQRATLEAQLALAGGR